MDSTSAISKIKLELPDLYTSIEESQEQITNWNEIRQDLEKLNWF